jgi:hypothetical protein
METIVKVNADELNQSLLDFVHINFKGKRISVHIYEDEADETEYLLSDAIHKAKILKTIEEVNANEGLKVYTMEEIRNYGDNRVKIQHS